MITKNQILKKSILKKNSLTKKGLQGCPQKKGTCLKIFITSPKKPNSAGRKTIKVMLLSNKAHIQCHIPGIGHSLQNYSTVLIRGAKVRDLPGIKYRAIRGKFDLIFVYNRKKARSKYGIPK
jgi:small subunit ribosomal protein S12